MAPPPVVPCSARRPGWGLRWRPGATPPKAQGGARTTRAGSVSEARAICSCPRLGQHGGACFGARGLPPPGG
eukprot:11212147-Lingulodinium_polyedra.AAC.1